VTTEKFIYQEIEEPFTGQIRPHRTQDTLKFQVVNGQLVLMRWKGQRTEDTPEDIPPERKGGEKS
jgi:hypothetical protein